MESVCIYRRGRRRVSPVGRRCAGGSGEPNTLRSDAGTFCSQVPVRISTGIFRFGFFFGLFLNPGVGDARWSDR